MSTPAQENESSPPSDPALSWRKTKKSIIRQVTDSHGRVKTIKRERTPVHRVDGIGIRELPSKSGEGVYYRVEVPASVTGSRVLKQFTRLDHAKGYAAQVAAQRERQGKAAFGLTDGQRIEAQKCFDRLTPLNVSLTNAVDFYLEHARPAGGERTVDKALDEYLGLKRTKNLRERSLGDLETRLNRFALAHGSKLVNAIFPPIVQDHLDVPGWSSQTRLNEWMVLHGFFKFCQVKKYGAANPVASVDKPQVGERSPEIFSVADCRCLLLAALTQPGLELGPALALGLFAGIRSEELNRLDWSAVKVNRQMVTIGPEVAKKRRIRNVTLTANAIAWLHAFGVKESGPVLPSDSRRRWDKLCTEAVLKKWMHNGCRHTFASCHYAMHDNASLTCNQLGQGSDAVLFNHYRSLMDKETAQEFFNIMPPEDQKIVALPVQQSEARANG